MPELCVRCNFSASNLIQIMGAKGNQKRVSELSLRLDEANVSNDADLQRRPFSEKCCLLWNAINTILISLYCQDGIGIDKSERILRVP